MENITIDDDASFIPAPARKFAPSEYQSAIFRWIKEGTGDAIVNAVAGSGKTTTLVEASRLLPPNASSLFCAFNAHIVKELTRRLDGMECKTIHSVGLATLARHWDKQPTVDSNKYSKLVRREAWKLADRLPTVSRSDLVSVLSDLVDYCQATLTFSNEHGGLAALVSHFGLVLPCALDDLTVSVSYVLREGITLASEEQVISFSDMLWLPWVWELRPRRYDWVFVDECQDLNAAQLDLVLKLRGGEYRRGRMPHEKGRMIFVGDPRQCQPAGTMILRPGGHGYNPIEHLKVGDKVASYDRRSAAFIGLERQGQKVLAISSRDYKGDMLTIEAGTKKTQCTPNHKWIARFSNRAPNTTVTYLMRRGGWYRVGWCQLFTAKGDLHLAQRARIEKADAAWILGVHKNRTDASIEESFIAAKFGLPTFPFQPVNGAQHITAKTIETLFNSLEIFLPTRVERCLTAFGRMIEHPFYVKSKQQRQGRTTIFETQACNLIPGLMSLPYYTNSKAVNWGVLEVQRAPFSGKVYSLKIEGHQTYIADGLATHNSIYGFSGADAESYAKIKTRTDATEFPLSVSYRCPVLVIREAQTIVPGILPRPNAPLGTVRWISETALYSEVKEGDLLLCRMTAPLISTCLDLIRQRVPARVRGKDIGRLLTKTVSVVSERGGFKFNDFPKFLQEHTDAQIKKLRGRDDTESQVERLYDLESALLASYDGMGMRETSTTDKSKPHPYGYSGWSGDESLQVKDFCDFISGLFSDDRPGVMLSTVHKAKGLESERVFILRPEKLPLIWKGQKSWEQLQEMNLKYVAITRSLDTLVYVRQGGEGQG